MQGAMRHASRARVITWSILGLLLYGLYKIVGKALIIQILVAIDALPTAILLDNLDDGSRLTQHIVMTALVDRGQDSIPGLVRVLNTSDSEAARANSAAVLGLIAKKHIGLRGVLAQAALGDLRTAMCDRVAMVRIQAARATWRIENRHSSVMPVIIDAWRSDCKEVKYLAAETLADMGPSAKDAVDILMLSLEDPDELVRAWANNALTQIRGHGVERK